MAAVATAVLLQTGVVWTGLLKARAPLHSPHHGLARGFGWALTISAPNASLLHSGEGISEAEKNQKLGTAAQLNGVFHSCSLARTEFPLQQKALLWPSDTLETTYGSWHEHYVL